MTRPHHHPMRDQRGFASVEHEHPGPEIRHTHEGQPELLLSMAEDAMLAGMKRAAARSGFRLHIPKS